MGFFDKLKAGLAKTKQLLQTDIRDLFKAGELLDELKLVEFEKRLLRTDMGVAAADAILAELREKHLGRTVVIDYERDSPRVSVRVQDMFGTRSHPTIANDVPLTIELLSPADRPIQITNDLPGFWAGSWAMVRKELAGRYPKHHWPVDPAAAPPQRLKHRPSD